jgi:hypothetical protein
VLVVAQPLPDARGAAVKAMPRPGSSSSSDVPSADAKATRKGEWVRVTRRALRAQDGRRVPDLDLAAGSPAAA